MQRYKLLVEYDGRPFCGWQRQHDRPSVQSAIEAAAAAIEGAPVTVQGSGRTDAGVHATGQVAHLDFTRPIEDRKIADALNAHLRPQPIAILQAAPVPNDFHARFDATARHYRYIIANRRADLAVRKGFAWRVPQRLDVDAMQAGAQALIGEHDFSTFRDTGCQADSPVRTLDRITVTRTGEQVEVTCSARSFLHRQVRSIVGSLVEVGRGREPAGWISDILTAQDRKACGPVAPSDGLYLERIDYPD